MDDLNLENGIYKGYAYSYPHKMSYRHFENPFRLHDLWSQEKNDNLFLYVHVPFCKVRCGFCNLLTIANSDESLPELYLKSLNLQSSVVKEHLKPFSVNQVAFGGGTPSFLNISELEQLFGTLKRDFAVEFHQHPCSFEISPDTVDLEKLEFLHQAGITRVSMGVQSFIEDECVAIGRPLNLEVIKNIFTHVSRLGFNTINYDLIYGIPGQTKETWLTSLKEFIASGATETYLYPLYVRPLTGIAKKDKEWSDERLELYRLARDFLKEQGFVQYSMRHFSKNDKVKSGEYSCQEDGMVGLGPGARSYTTNLHYCNEYAVKRPGVMSIIQKYLSMTSDDFQNAYYGIQLNLEERKRRYFIKSILQCDGLLVNDYRDYFSSAVYDDFIEIENLIKRGYAKEEGERLILTERGIEYSDVLGPLFYSKVIRNRVEEYELT